MHHVDSGVAESFFSEKNNSALVQLLFCFSFLRTFKMPEAKSKVRGHRLQQPYVPRT